MTRSCKNRLWRSALRSSLAASLGLLVSAGAMPAHAESQADANSVTVRLIQLLIQKGVLSKGQASSLLQQAVSENGARPARAPKRHGKAPAPAPVDEVAEQEAPPTQQGEVRVTYVPQFVRQQIAQQVRNEVLAEAHAQGGLGSDWGNVPSNMPEWMQRTHIYGDLRVRYERDMFDPGNYPGFFNFNTINNGPPLDVASTNTNPQIPTLNTTENRNRYRLRARLGFETAIDDTISTNIRIGTGSDSSPITLNQNLGQPGDFQKYAIWLDRAYLDIKPMKGLEVFAGRGPNPFWTSELLFDDELGFDGISAQYKTPVSRDVSVFLNTGAFPVFNTALDFATYSPVKFQSHDAYLFAAQGGAEWKANKETTFKGAVGYFAFSNVEGSQQACTVLYATQPCPSDNSRAPFVTFGNTLFPIRDIVPNTVFTGQPEYYGLASRFDILDLHGRVDLTNYHPIDIALEGDFVKNLAFNRSSIVARNPQSNIGFNGAYEGGDTGYQGKITVGHLDIKKRWDWNIYGGYRYLESDAVLDSMTDSDFHLGGTNAKGYFIGGKLGVARDTFVEARWMSANVVSGLPYSNDILQLDLMSEF